ncbi:MAG: hypothetical protein HUU43_12735 [Ignavibacteriaceae bacterium]|nr:hypothetical protein [Ignavibacteriaceae bacterium]
MYLDISVAVSSVLLYLINSLVLKHLLHSPFLSFYFNDIMGGALFISYLNLLFGWFRVKEHLLRKFHVIVFIMLAAGVGWEYLTPLYKESTSDPYDLLAYQAGGLIYFTGILITKRFCGGTSGVQK